jgi:hypothetical protein
MASRPNQGVAPVRKPPRAAFRADSAPRRVSLGSVSRPVARGAWRLGRIVADATPKRVKL